MEPRRRLILYIIVSFILGAIGGGFVGSKLAGRHDWPDRREGGSPLKQFSERLKLDERQTATVDSILEGHRAVFDTLRKSYGKAFRMQERAGVVIRASPTQFAPWISILFIREGSILSLWVWSSIVREPKTTARDVRGYTPPEPW